MKKMLLFTAIVCLATLLKAQNTNLIFFTEQGERFSVVLNGVLQNLQPETNIKVTDLPAPSYKLKLIFEDKKIADLDKNLFFNQGTETTFCIKKNKNQEYVVRFMNEVPIEEAPRPVAQQQVIVYHPEPVTATTTTTTTTINNPGMGGGGVGVSVTDPYSGTNLNINMNVGGVGTQSSTTTTTTTTTSSGGYENNYSNNQYEDNRNDGEGHGHGNHNKPHEERYILPGYNGVYGCPFPMAPSDFEQAKQSIKSKSFEDSKLTIAKQIINTNCLLSGQVKEIMLLFSFEDTRLELAKFAYGYTLDIGNYYKVNDAFTFESSIDELNTYTAGFRR
ncbi:MAG: DUF4476 domain-containing protein [Bacteroidales bacterium]|nr:DUF4476 domain-containing protein [Bacteroidales bacterium]